MDLQLVIDDDLDSFFSFPFRAAKDSTSIRTATKFNKRKDFLYPHLFIHLL